MNTKYNLTITPLWATKSGNFKGLKVSKEVMEALAQVAEGGYLLVRNLKEASRKNETSPNAYLEYITPESVAEFANQAPKFKGKNFNGSKKTQTADEI